MKDVRGQGANVNEPVSQAFEMKYYYHGGWPMIDVNVDEKLTGTCASDGDESKLVYARG